MVWKVLIKKPHNLLLTLAGGGESKHNTDICILYLLELGAAYRGHS